MLVKNQYFWQNLLKRYWNYVPLKNIPLELELFRICLDDLKAMSPCEWYDFLLNKYLEKIKKMGPARARQIMPNFCC
ncbi:hypothetical protein JCM12298_03790 [Desulfothermus naphthae]